MHKLKPIHRDLIISFLLVVITVAVFWQVSSFDFVHFDDNTYVYDNAYVQSGLNWNSIKRASSFELAEKSRFWHPVTWLSLMLDYQIFGLNPHGYHLINLLFHVINTVLLFLIFHRMTKTLWQSAFVACLFAIHPLHVESVAWIAERKDVLSTFFWMLTMGAYNYYVECPGFRRYFLVLLFFILGLMTKPMLVTLPFVLLLLDYWPLQRFQKIKAYQEIKDEVFKSVSSDKQKEKSKEQHAVRESLEAKKPADPEYKWALIYPLLREKVPLFVLAILSSIVTYIAQHIIGFVQSIEAFPLSVRIGNAFISYITYIGKTVWPSNLAVFYPHPEFLLPWQAFGSVLLLIAVTLAVFRMIKRSPYLATGWFWYTGTLIPVIGLVQIGDFAMADRYTYIPLIGLFIVVAWGVPELLKKWRYRKEALFTLSALSILCLCIITWLQVGYWQNSLTLFARALSVTKNNALIESNMGAALAEQGKFGEAIGHYQEALRIKPNDCEARYNLANALARQGKMEEAVSHYAGILQTQPDAAAVHNNMGIALSQLGRTDEAIVHFREAIRMKPDFQDAGSNLETALMGQTRTKEPVPEKVAIQPADPNSAEGQLRTGLSLFQEGKADEAIPRFEEALRLNPNLVAAHVSLGLIMAQKRNLDKAIDHFRKALKIKPDIAETHNSLGVALTYKGALDEAIEHFETALKINPRFAKAHNSLAVALAQKGRRDEAISHLRKALQLQPDYEEAKRNLNILLNMQGKS